MFVGLRTHDGAAEVFDSAIAACRSGGFKEFILRGDTDVSLTKNFDRRDAEGVRFVFGYDASEALSSRADGVPEGEYAELVRYATDVFSGIDRSKQPRVKEAMVVQREYLDIRLESEDIAELEYKPSKTKKTHRMVVLRRNLVEERGQLHLCDRVRYFFYITNDRDMTKEESEGLVRPAPPTSNRWSDRHEAEREEVLRMAFRTFLDNVMLVPAQVVRTGRRLVFRLLAWRPRLHILVRLLDAL